MKHRIMIPFLPRTYLLCLGLFISLFSACSSGSGTSAAGESGTEAAATFLAPDFLSAETINALNEIKAVFDQGISKGFGDRPPAYVYEQHALRMRMDYFDDDPYTSVFPYNGEFDLSGLTEAVSKLPFITKKCGFQDPTTKEIINYFCFNTNPDYMSYLAAVGENSDLIKGFQYHYQEVKTIDQTLRQNMLTQSVEQIDFASLDQQYFYMMFHIIANEERLALDQLQAQLD